MLDFQALEKEMEEAIAADEKYQRENDAKFRAVHQKVASYEEFRDIVLASHLKPLEKKDKMKKGRNVLWNCCATKTNCRQESELELSQELDKLPETSAEFYRDWRRCLKNSQERYQFLLYFGSHKLGWIFQNDLAFGLLGEFLIVLTENACIKDQDSVLDILESFSRTKRFGLNVELLSKREKEACRQLFEKLQRIATGPSNPLEPSDASAEEYVPVTQVQSQSDESRLMELMHRYHIT